MAELLIPEGMEESPTHVALVLTFDEACALAVLTGNVNAGEKRTTNVYEELVKNKIIEEAADNFVLLDADGNRIELITFEEIQE